MESAIYWHSYGNSRRSDMHLTQFTSKLIRLLSKFHNHDYFVPRTRAHAAVFALVLADFAVGL